MKKRLLLALAVTLVIGAIFFWFIDLDQVIELLRQADWRLLAAGMGALLVSYVLLAVRWRYLLANRTGFFPSFHAINISNLVNSLTPIPEIALRVLITGRSANMSIPGATSGAVDTMGTAHHFVALVAITIELFPLPRLGVDDILYPTHTVPPFP